MLDRLVRVVLVVLDLFLGVTAVFGAILGGMIGIAAFVSAAADVQHPPRSRSSSAQRVPLRTNVLDTGGAPA
jgi:hypothetical protein